MKRLCFCTISVKKRDKDLARKSAAGFTHLRSSGSTSSPSSWTCTGSSAWSRGWPSVLGPALSTPRRPRPKGRLTWADLGFQHAELEAHRKLLEGCNLPKLSGNSDLACSVLKSGIVRCIPLWRSLVWVWEEVKRMLKSVLLVRLNTKLSLIPNESLSRWHFSSVV